MQIDQHEDSDVDVDTAQLGARLRHARRLRAMTLKECAEAAQCSEGQLSKVERGASVPSLALLHRLARIFHTNVSELLGTSDPGASPVLSSGARQITKFGAEPRGISLERMDRAAPGSLIQAHIHIIPPGAKSDGLIEHVGEEVGYVISGVVRLTVGGETYELKAGDGFHFPSNVPHGYENTGKFESKIYWVNTPATF